MKCTDRMKRLIVGVALFILMAAPASAQYGGEWGSYYTDTVTAVVNPAGLADSTYITDGRPFVWDCGGTVKFGDVVYIATDSDYEGADSDALSTMPAIAVCVTQGGAAGGGTATFITSGWVKWSGWTNITAASDSVYAYVGTTAGEVTQVKPSGTGDIVQVVGTIHGDGLVHLDLDKTEVTLP